MAERGFLALAVDIINSDPGGLTAEEVVERALNLAAKRGTTITDSDNPVASLGGTLHKYHRMHGLRRVMGPHRKYLYYPGAPRTARRIPMTIRNPTDRVQAVFQDARALQADALEMLALGKFRNAAEKAWGATKRATDALVLARTSEEPERTPETGAGLRLLESHDEGVRSVHLTRRYYARQGHLHGECFYNGLCEPVEDTERMIRRTSAYIEDAERLATGS